MMDNDHVCPLIGSVFPFDVILFEDFYSLDFLRVNFSAVEQIVICKQYYFKNAKLMSVMKFLKMHFSVKQANFVKCDVNSEFTASPTGVRMPFVTVCFQTNPCFS